MKKYVIHGVYLLLILFFVVLSNIKAKEAEKQTSLALQKTREAERSTRIAEQEAARAVEHEAMYHNALKELEACKSAQK